MSLDEESGCSSADVLSGCCCGCRHEGFNLSPNKTVYVYLYMCLPLDRQILTQILRPEIPTGFFFCFVFLSFLFFSFNQF